jgi:hypothetical protein
MGTCSSFERVWSATTPIPDARSLALRDEGILSVSYEGALDKVLLRPIRSSSSIPPRARANRGGPETLEALPEAVP